jgi:hypothetical protein
MSLRAFIRRLKCRFGRHDYYVIQHYSRTMRKVGCQHCDMTWGMNDTVMAFIPWDHELDELVTVCYGASDQVQRCSTDQPPTWWCKEWER